MAMTKTLWLVPTLAAAAMAAGCGSRGRSEAEAGWQTCVDQQGRVVDERQCQGPDGRAHTPYRWYYYPHGGPLYPIGYGIPTGGSYSDRPYAGVPTHSIGAATPGAARPAATGTARGGFGSTASGSAGA